MTIRLPSAPRPRTPAQAASRVAWLVSMALVGAAFVIAPDGWRSIVAILLAGVSGIVGSLAEDLARIGKEDPPCE